MSLRSRLDPGTGGSHFSLQVNTSVPVHLQHLSLLELYEDCVTCLLLSIPPQAILDTYELAQRNADQRLLSPRQQLQVVEIKTNEDLEQGWTGPASELEDQLLALRWQGVGQTSLSLPLHSRTLPPKRGSQDDLFDYYVVPPARGFVSCNGSKPIDQSSDAQTHFNNTPATHPLLSIDSSDSLTHREPVGNLDDLPFVDNMTSIVRWLCALWLVYLALRSPSAVAKRSSKDPTSPPPPTPPEKLAKPLVRK